VDAEGRNKLIAEIAAALDDAEKAIRRHPEKTVLIYERGAAAFLEGHDAVDAPEELRSAGLEPSEFRVLRRYLTATSFMSAWYHNYGYTDQRDKCAQSASRWIAATGVSSSEATFIEFLRSEKLWRETLADHGIVSPLLRPRVKLALLIGLAGGLYWYFG
jgi:hypothetical protein